MINGRTWNRKREHKSSPSCSLGGRTHGWMIAKKKFYVSVAFCVRCERSVFGRKVKSPARDRARSGKICFGPNKFYVLMFTSGWWARRGSRSWDRKLHNEKRTEMRSFESSWLGGDRDIGEKFSGELTLQSLNWSTKWIASLEFSHFSILFNKIWKFQ